MTTKQPKIGIVTVVYSESQEMVNNFVENLSKVDYSNFRLFLINNNKKRNLMDEIGKKYSFITIFNNKNTGFTGGSNKGISEALNKNAKYILLQNCDTKVRRSILKDLLHAFNADSSIGLVCPIIYSGGKNKIWYAGGKFDQVFGYARTYHIGRSIRTNKKKIASEQTGTITGCSALISSKVFKKIGFFDENLFMYFEDIDLSLRASKVGYNSYFLAKPLVKHMKIGSRLSALEAYYFGRNPFLLIKKHFIFPFNLSAYLGQFLIRLPRNLLRAKNADAAWKYIRGIWHGVIGVTGKAKI